MKLKWSVLAVAVLATSTLFVAETEAQSKSSKKPAPKPAAKAAPKIDNGLVGVKLYDSLGTVLSKFGNPVEIQSVSGGGGAVAPVGGGSSGGRGGGGGGRAGGGGGRGQGGEDEDGRGLLNIGDNDFRLGNEMLRQGPEGATAAGGGGGATGADTGPGGPAGGGGGGAAGGAGGSGGAAGSGNRILFTRYVYNKGNSKYGFVMDKGGKVVQVEAMGMNDSRVRTAKGIGFGAKAIDIIKAYGTPEGYEIAGNVLVLRYLVTNKVVFRLNRLGKDKPHVVTGIVVAGGKI